MGPQDTSCRWGAKARLVAAAAASAFLAAAAITSGAAAQNSTSGVQRAREAGTVIDPKAVSIMEAAPDGSCLNDPIQAKCKRPKKIVAARTTRMPDGSLGYSLVDPTGKSDKAHVAQIPQCFLRIGYPYPSGGWMYADGANQCSAAVSDQELYTQLYRTTEGVWRLLDSSVAYGAGNRTIRATAAYNCGHPNLRHYRGRANGYADVNGTWYAAQQDKDDYHTCPN